jgi:hypothetical protein
MDNVWGEIVSSDTQALEVECHSLYRSPAFGGFVRADCVGSRMSYFGVVTGVSTGPFDGNRLVQAHRMPPGELEERKPHLTTLLRTTFQARIVGYGQDAVRLPGTPPSPPRLHCYVYPAGEEEIRSLTGSPGFLRPLCQVQDSPLEDLLVCAIRVAAEAWGPTPPVVAWGKYLARLLRNDYVTLEGVIQRLGAVPAPGFLPPGPAPGLLPGPLSSPGAAPAAGAQAPSASATQAPPERPHPRWEEPLPLAGSGPGGNGPMGKPPKRNRDPFED